MKKIKLGLSVNPYDIVIGRNILSSLGKSIKELKIGLDAIIITNATIDKFYGKIVLASLKKAGFSVKSILVPDSEKAKTAKIALDVISQIAEYDKFKRPFIIALGGGVVGDLSGFVAAIYKRGIPVVQVPTTFLAQIDSSIGGKTAIDLPIGKNLVGAFYQPSQVYSDVKVLKSLTKRQILAGFAEAVKYGIIYDKKLFEYIELNYKKLLNLDLQSLDHVVQTCSKIKAKIVKLDERELKSIRTILNFGHTVGHAIEAACKYDKYNHGEAVALGMRIATDVSVKTKLLTQLKADKINNLLDLIGLPKQIKGVDFNKILDVMKHDKKFISGKNRFVLVVDIGKVKVVEGISINIVESSIKKYLA